VERGVVNHTSLWHVCGAQALTSTVVLAAEAAIEAAAAATQASLTQKKASASDSILLAAATAHDRIARGARLGQLSTMELQALVKGVFAARKERGSSKYTSKKETMVQFLGTVEKIGELFGEPPTPPANALADPPRTAARNGLAAPPIVTQSPDALKHTLTLPHTPTLSLSLSYALICALTLSLTLSLSLSLSKTLSHTPTHSLSLTLQRTLSHTLSHTP
jgi:hypothetical protein